jgi:hypothetical protein
VFVSDDSEKTLQGCDAYTSVCGFLDFFRQKITIPRVDHCQPALPDEILTQRIQQILHPGWFFFKYEMPDFVFQVKSSK